MGEPKPRFLSAEDVAAAECNTASNHAVLRVLTAHADDIAQQNAAYIQIPAGQDRANFLKTEYGFLADSLARNNDFTLEPEDLITLWAHVVEIFPGNDFLQQRYALVGMIAHAYAINGLDNPTLWQEYPRLFQQEQNIPRRFMMETDGLLHVEERVTHIKASLDVLDEYRHGSSQSIRSLAFAPQDEIDRQQALESERSTPVIQEVTENFRTIVGVVQMQLQEFLHQ